MIGEPCRLALGIPASPATGERKRYMPTLVRVGEVPDLVRQHIAGTIDRRPGVIRDTKLLMIDGATWLGAYAIQRIDGRHVRGQGSAA